MIQVGLTGNVAAGKSTVARIWERMGVPVVSADDLARRAVESGGPAVEEIRDAFGDQVFSDEGELDRDRLRELVFSDETARRRLEVVLHPHIRSLRGQWLEQRRLEGASLVVSEVPLLYEAGLEDQFDVVVVVDAPASTREERLVNLRGISRAEAKRIMSAQGDPVEKRERADYVIANQEGPEALEASASQVLSEILGRPLESGFGPDE